MLLSFSISNYRSIREKVTLSLLPVKTYKELPNNIVSIDQKATVLRSAVIYGANASGKSNVLKALIDFIEYIKESSSKKMKEIVNIYDPFLLDKTSLYAPSEFEIEFLLDGIRYVYSVSVHSMQIIKESLSYYPKGQIVRIFERYDISKFKYGTVLKGEKKSIENRLLNNQLYLSKAATEKLDILEDVYNYFGSFHDIYTSLSSISEYMSQGTILGTALKEEDEATFEQFEKIILALDVGIYALKIKENERSGGLLDLFPQKIPDIINAEQIPKDMPEFKYELTAIHRAYDNKTKEEVYVEFPLDKESSGTRNLFILALSLLYHFKKGTVMIIDEFERSLHPHIVHKIVQLFHDPDLNVNNAQLIFSTHAINLLDNTIFRRDQIWFTEKNEFGVTDLYALSQIEGVRKDIPYDKWYLSGRFGATPVVSEPDLKFNNDLQEGK